jgi:hypothetical protein
MAERDPLRDLEKRARQSGREKAESFIAKTSKPRRGKWVMIDWFICEFFHRKFHTCSHTAKTGPLLMRCRCTKCDRHWLTPR